jgi:hypothetical protein
MYSYLEHIMLFKMKLILFIVTFTTIIWESDALYYLVLYLGELFSNECRIQADNLMKLSYFIDFNDEMLANFNS